MTAAEFINRQRAICRDCTEYPHGCLECVKTELERREADYRETVADAERDEEGV